MAVILETSLGSLTIDLHTDASPQACRSFLLLCHAKQYNDTKLHRVERGFLAQSGITDKHQSQSAYTQLRKPSSFPAECDPATAPPADAVQYLGAAGKQRWRQHRSHYQRGVVSMVCNQSPDVPKGTISSLFFVTLSEQPLTYLDGQHIVIGQVTEDHQQVLEQLNSTLVNDETYAPMQHIRIRHTMVLFDPFPLLRNPSNMPQQIAVPPQSPTPVQDSLDKEVIEYKQMVQQRQQSGKTAEQLAADREALETGQRALVLEMIGDLPSADVKPPDTVLFVAKLNPVTTSEDLELIFSRFGQIVDCEILRDRETGTSLQYAFIEFSEKSACEEAYLKMNNVLIDDRRIKVDFSQSVSKLWNKRHRSKHKPHNRHQQQHPMHNEYRPRSDEQYSSQMSDGEGKSYHGGSSRSHPSSRDSRQHRDERRHDSQYRERRHSRSRSPRQSDRPYRRHDNDDRYQRRHAHDRHRDDYRDR